MYPTDVPPPGLGVSREYGVILFLLWVLIIIFWVLLLSGSPAAPNATANFPDLVPVQPAAPENSSFVPLFSPARRGLGLPVILAVPTANNLPAFLVDSNNKLGPRVPPERCTHSLPRLPGWVPPEKPGHFPFWTSQFAAPVAVPKNPCADFCFGNRPVNGTLGPRLPGATNARTC